MVTRDGKIVLECGYGLANREKRQQFNQLGHAIYTLIRQTTSPGKYSLGVALAVSSEEGVMVRGVVPGSAAEQGGLKAGDQIIAANGQALADDPMAVIGPLVDAGKEITFHIRRGEETLDTMVTPKPKP